ncbi:transcription factor bHLH91-like [Capsicum chacoense]
MDDFELDFDQLDQLLNILSPPTLQKQDSSISLHTQICNDIDSHQKHKPVITTTTTIIDDDQLLNFLSSPPSPRSPLTSTHQKDDDDLSILLQTHSCNDLDSLQNDEPIITTTTTTIFDDDQLLNLTSTLQKDDDSSILLQTHSSNDLDSHQNDEPIITTTTTLFDDDQLFNFLSSPPSSPRPPLTSTLQKDDYSSILLQTHSSNDLDSHQNDEPIITTTTTTIFDDDQLFNFLSTPSASPHPPLTSTLQKEDDSSISLQTHQSSNDLDNHQKDEPINTNTTIVDDNQVQDPMKKKEVEEKKKKNKNVLRRDVERQRRRDMAKLYQRLRLLIPSKYLMGKRAISDHLEEIVDYVKDLRKDIEELERKRESLKEKKNMTPSSSSSMKLSDDEDRITVKSCNEEVEISVKGGIPISKVVKVVMKEGLIVNSCVSSTVGQSLHHIIQSEVNTRADIDFAMLQTKLISLYEP